MRSDEVYFFRRIRVAPLAELAAEPSLDDFADTLEKLHIDRQAKLESVDKEIKRTRPSALSSPAIYGGIAASAGGLVDAITTTTTGVPWVSLSFAVGGVLSGAVGARDKRCQNDLRANRNFERRVLRRDLEEITAARKRVRRALAQRGG